MERETIYKFTLSHEDIQQAIAEYVYTHTGKAADYATAQLYPRGDSEAFDVVATVTT